MKITSTLISVKNYIPLLIKKFESIVNGKKVLEAGSGKEIELIESKTIAKERKTVKESFYTFIDAQYSNLDNDFHQVKSNNKDIVITPDEFEQIMANFRMEIAKTCETFVTEKKMAPSLTKYVTIALAGLLIENLNNKSEK